MVDWHCWKLPHSGTHMQVLHTRTESTCAHVHTILVTLHITVASMVQPLTRH